MSDLFGNQIDGFPTRRLIYSSGRKEQSLQCQRITEIDASLHFADFAKKNKDDVMKQGWNT